MEKVLQQCDVCRAFEKDPHLLEAGTSSASAFNEKTQLGLPFLDDTIARHAMEPYSKDPLSAPPRPKKPIGIAVCQLRLASRSSWPSEVLPDR